MKRNFTYLKAMLVAVLFTFGMSAFAQYSGTGTFTKITDVSELESGAYYVLYGVNGTNEGAMNTTLSSGKMGATTLTVSSNEITNPSTDVVWKIEGNATTGYTVFNEATNTYCEITKSSTKGFSTNANSTHTYEISATSGDFKIKSNNTSAGGRCISIYQKDFRSYTSPKALNLYKYKITTTEPTISASSSSVSFSAEVGGSSVSKDITVTGANLSEDIAVALSGDAQFATTTTTLSTLGGTITVSYTPTATAGTHTATLTLTSAGATEIVVNLTGETTEPLSLDGAGTEASPYSVADVLTQLNNSGEKAWIIGYIVGVPTGGGSGVLSNVELAAPFSRNSTIALAANEGETDLSKMIPIQLPSGTVRTAINLQDNPSLLGKSVKVYGDLLAYFTAPGVKNTSDYVLDPLSNLSSNEVLAANAWIANGKVNFTATAGEQVNIYNVAGQRLVSTTAKEGINSLAVNANGVLIVKVDNRVSKVIL